MHVLCMYFVSELSYAHIEDRSQAANFSRQVREGEHASARAFFLPFIFFMLKLVRGGGTL